MGDTSFRHKSPINLSSAPSSACVLVASNASTMDPDQTDALASIVKLLWSASEYMQQM